MTKRRKRKVHRFEEVTPEEVEQRKAWVQSQWDERTEAARRGVKYWQRDRQSNEATVEIREVSWPEGIPKDVCEMGFPF